jgi:hypothetical protein
MEGWYISLEYDALNISVNPPKTKFKNIKKNKIDIFNRLKQKTKTRHAKKNET